MSAALEDPLNVVFICSDILLHFNLEMPAKRVRGLQRCLIYKGGGEEEEEEEAKERWQQGMQRWQEAAGRSET